MKCSKCGSESGQYKSGISKKTGRPWKGWKCSSCNEMTFLKAENAPGVPQVASGAIHPIFASILQEFKTLNAKLQRIVDLLAKEKGEISVGPEELEPDSEGLPF